MSVIVLVFALKLFGVFEITPPQAVMADRGRDRTWRRRLIFSRRFRDCLATPSPRRFSEPPLALPSLNQPPSSWHVRRHRGRHERALFFAQRATRLAAISAQARPVDGAT